MSDHVCDIRELIDGRAGVPTGELDGWLTDSDTGAELHPQLASSLAAVASATSAAAATHATGGWSELPVGQRVSALQRLQSELATRVEAMACADSLDSGVPLTLTTAIIGARVAMIEASIAQLAGGFGHTELPSSAGAVDRWRLPWGPAAILTPWNGPAATAISKTVDALVAGCPVIVKPSEWAPHFTGAFIEAVIAADLPPGTIQVVHGGAAVGAALVADPRVQAVSYTGGVAGGTAVAEACARQLKPADLELSGNNPVVVLPDADPATVAAEVVAGMLILNGQICVGPRRLIVPRERLEAHVSALSELLTEVVIGPTDDPGTQVGPLAHEPHRHAIEARITELEAEGCEVRRFGTLPAKGHFVRPAVVLATTAASVRDEIFGPVLAVLAYDSTDEAIELANDHAFGLAAYVFSADRELARSIGRRLRAGLVTINSVLGGQDDVPAVGSAWGSSGLGILGLGQGPDFFSGHRFVG